jgi:hypothetical protein
MGARATVCVIGIVATGSAVALGEGVGVGDAGSVGLGASMLVGTGWVVLVMDAAGGSVVQPVDSTITHTISVPSSWRGCWRAMAPTYTINLSAFVCYLRCMILDLLLNCGGPNRAPVLTKQEEPDALRDATAAILIRR